MFFQKRQFALNAYTFNLEYWGENDAGNKEKIDCFNIDRFSEHTDTIDTTGINSSIEIYSSSHTFLPESVRFYFNNQEDFEKLALFLTNLTERRMKMDYKEQISWFYLNREYEKLMPRTEQIWTDGVMKEDTVRAYLKNLNVTDEKIFQMISEHFSRTNSASDIRQGNIFFVLSDFV